MMMTTTAPLILSKKKKEMCNTELALAHISVPVKLQAPRNKPWYIDS
jgi:hypothetical protein